MISRRQLLRLGAGGAVVAGLAACHSGRSLAQPSPGATVTGSPGGAGAPTPPSWDSLARSLSGRLVRPGAVGYDATRELFNPTFDAVHPEAIATCANTADVQTALAFARARALPVAVRSGGHSYTGASTTTGLVIDLRALNAVRYQPGTGGAGVATIGGGALLIDGYAALATHGVSVPGGSCATVGFGGLTLGGGYGVVSRAHGLTCDTLVSAEVVLADGTVVHASADQEPDLFWALRGGGGSLGIVTAFQLRTHPIRDVVLFAVGWPWGAAGAVLGAWQHWGPGAPDATFSTCKLLATDTHGRGTTPTVGVYGLHLGSATELSSLLDDLVRAVGSAPSYRTSSGSGYLPAMLTEAGCADRTVVGCHLAGESPGGQLTREAFRAGSDYLDAPMPYAGIAALVEAVQARQDDPTLIRGGTSFDAYGGAINRVANDATAFVHRASLAVLQHTVSWSVTEPPAVVSAAVAANTKSLAFLQAAVHPYMSGAAYQNYLDPSLADPASAYFGTNLARLRRVVTHYDPDGVFVHTALGR